MKMKYLLSLFAGCALSVTSIAAVTVDESKPVAKPHIAPTTGTSRSIDPSTADAPRNDRKPLGTAIGGANSVTPITKQGEQPLAMKCWQDGKLIIDQPIKSLPADAQKNATMTNATTGNSVYAFDFKNAMCIVK